MTVGIYCISDSKTKSVLYVGQSKNIEERWRKHKNRLINGTHLEKFSSWFDSIENDISRLKFEILEECTNTDYEKNRAEIKWFNELNPLFYGSVPSNKSTWSHSLSTKEAIRKSITEKYKGKRIIDTDQICNFCGCAFRRKNKRTYCSIKCKASSSRKEVDIDLLHELYESGLTTIQLREIFSISAGKLDSVLKSSGIKVRSNSEAQKLSRRNSKPRPSQRKYYEFKCRQCGILFESPKKDRVYCGRDCNYQGQRKTANA